MLSVVATVLVLVFFVTSGDSATLVLGMMSTGGNPNPGARVKIVWGLLVAGIAASLLLAGGVKAVQTATIVFALPFTARDPADGRGAAACGARRLAGRTGRREPVARALARDRARSNPGPIASCPST